MIASVPNMRVPRVERSSRHTATHGPRSRTPFSARGQEEGLLQRLQLLRHGGLGGVQTGFTYNDPHHDPINWNGQSEILISLNDTLDDDDDDDDDDDGRYYACDSFDCDFDDDYYHHECSSYCVGNQPSTAPSQQKLSTTIHPVLIQDNKHLPCCLILSAEALQ